MRTARIAAIILLTLILMGQGTNTNVGTLNGIKFALQYPGSDIGAKINAAAATCISGQQCHIVIPTAAQLSFSTGIVFVNNETLECTTHGELGNDTGGDSFPVLKYTGSTTAISMPVIGGRLVGCGLLLGSTTTTGVFIGGTGNTAYSNHIVDAEIRGGGTGTTSLHISCNGGACEDNHLAMSRISDFIGVGVAIDYANDTYLYQNTVYAKAGNSTSTHLLIDSSAGGIIVDNFVGGSVGLHGFVERRTLGGNFPTFIFANDIEMDGTSASTECWLFDSTLGSANIDATFMNSWAAGCNGPGIHISGGSGIHIGAGSRIRVNQKDGILIDVPVAAEYGTIIADSYIQGNNQSNGSFNGISITGHPGNVVITGNHINDFPEVGGHQVYALGATGDVEGLIFNGNDCSNNATGCYNVPGVVGTKLAIAGNVDPGAGTVTIFPGDVVSVGNVSAGGGTSTVFRCATAGATLPTGSLTIVAGACGTTVDTGLRVK